MATQRGKIDNSDRFYFLASKTTVNSDCSHEIKGHLFLGRKDVTNLDSVLKSRDITFPSKVYIIKPLLFPLVMCWMWELDHKEDWVLKNGCFSTVVLEKTLENPLDRKEIKPVRPKGNRSWIFIGRTDAEAEAPILWPSDAKNQFIRRDSDAGKDWRQEEKEMTEDKMVAWHHRLIGHTFEQALGDG